MKGEQYSLPVPTAAPPEKYCRHRTRNASGGTAPLARGAGGDQQILGADCVVEPHSLLNDSMENFRL
ncbi:MAG: hypothetical protein ABI907_12795 [Ramlibacter sp.]